MSGAKYRCKPVRDTIKEVETLLDIEKKLFFFVDDNFIGNRRHRKELLRELISLKIVYFADVSINLARDEELLSLLAGSGCRKVVIGFESLVNANLRQMGKDKSYKIEQYAEDIMKIQSFGIEIQGFFIFGYDFDDETVFEKSVDFINNANLLIEISLPDPTFIIWPIHFSDLLAFTMKSEQSSTYKKSLVCVPSP